jgi:uncharacterized protein YbbC (DUF1343 family)
MGLGDFMGIKLKGIAPLLLILTATVQLACATKSQVEISRATAKEVSKSTVVNDAAKAATKTVVKLGNETLLTEPYLSLVRGKRIGLLAHFASRNSSGAHLVDVLAARTDLQLKMIFSPEHGFRGVEDAPVRDSKDSVTGLPVYSLYGPRRAPTSAMMSQIDVILIDLQDIGLRYYTYPATIAYVLDAASDANIPVLILDRPNPLNGAVVEGATLDANLADRGLTTIAQIPTRHGMTIGEISLYLNAKLGLDASLTVVPMTGWTRAMNWIDTGLTWVPPSPALVNSDQGDLYAMFGTLESMSLAVGRGVQNDDAFREYGAPWITENKANLLVSELSRVLPANTSGLKFTYEEWTADRAVYLHQLCRGFRVDIVDLKKADAFRALMETSKAMYRILGPTINVYGSLSMLGARWLVDGIEANETTDELEKKADASSVIFLAERKKYLLY